MNSQTLHFYSRVKKETTSILKGQRFSWDIYCYRKQCHLFLCLQSGREMVIPKGKKLKHSCNIKNVPFDASGQVCQRSTQELYEWTIGYIFFSILCQITRDWFTFVSVNVLAYSLLNGGIITSDTVAINNFMKVPNLYRFQNEGDCLLEV